MQRRFNRRAKPKAEIKNFRINQEIKVPEVRVIDEEGNPLGVLTTHDALKMAEERELDLIEVNPKGEPPVCKLVDYNKFLYQQEKKEQKANKSKPTEVKNIRLSVRIGQHDIDVRLNQVAKFFEKSHPVKIDLNLKGRERAHADLAKEMIDNFIAKAKEKLGEDKVLVDQPAVRQGNSFFAIIRGK